ncbi:MAG: ankyrin repeat domain-containing protein [Candidatus Babeliales bacterium]
MQSYIQKLGLALLLANTGIFTAFAMERFTTWLRSMSKSAAEQRAERQREQNDLTDLRFASFEGDVDTVKKLMSQGVDASKPNEFGQTPLQFAYNQRLLNAIREGTAETLAQVLQEGGYQLEARSSMDKTPLQEAASLGKGTMVKMLLDNGAKTETPNTYGATALHFAANFNPEKDYRGEWNDLDPMDVLLSAGADVDATTQRSGFIEGGRTPLFNALDGGYIPHIQKLIEAGADVNAARDDGKTALQYPIIQEKPDRFNALIFTVTPKEIQHIFPSIRVFAQRKHTGQSKDVGRLIIQELFKQLVTGKVARAKLYNPQITEQQLEAGIKLLRQSFNRVWNKTLGLQKGVKEEAKDVGLADVQESDAR